MKTIGACRLLLAGGGLWFALGCDVIGKVAGVSSGQPDCYHYVSCDAVSVLTGAHKNPKNRDDWFIPVSMKFGDGLQNLCVAAKELPACVAASEVGSIQTVACFESAEKAGVFVKNSGRRACRDSVVKYDCPAPHATGLREKAGAVLLWGSDAREHLDNP